MATIGLKYQSSTKQISQNILIINQILEIEVILNGNNTFQIIVNKGTNENVYILGIK